MLCLSLALLTTGPATGLTARAQSQDRLHERLDFLKTKLETYLTHSIIAEGINVGDIKFEAVRFETCRVTWKSSSVIGSNEKIPVQLREFTIVNQVTVNLASIDPARTTLHVIEEMKKRNIPGSLSLQLTTRPGSPGFTEQLVTNKRGQITRATVQERQIGLSFDPRDQRVAEEVSKAFADLSTICRSRASR